MFFFPSTTTHKQEKNASISYSNCTATADQTGPNKSVKFVSGGHFRGLLIRDGHLASKGRLGPIVRTSRRPKKRSGHSSPTLFLLDHVH